MVPAARPQSYYGRAILAEPVWKPEVGLYLFTGGLGGAGLALAAGAQLSGNDVLARRSRLIAMAALGVSPVLLILDLGRPARFAAMFRVLKPTSPMSVGTWLLSAAGAAAATAAGSDLLGVLPGIGRVATLAGGVLGPGVATYTAVLLSDTAVPVWHGAATELPFVFAATAAMSAGAAATLITPPTAAGPARRMAVGGAIAGLGAAELMERRLGPIADPYRTGRAGQLARVARALTVVGAITVTTGGRKWALATLGAAELLAAAVCERFSVFRAGFQSAADPAATVGPQRARLVAHTTAPSRK